MHTTTEPSSPEAAQRVLTILQDRAIGDIAAMSVRQIGDALGIGRSTASRALHRLVSEGKISEHRRGTGDGYPSQWKLEA